MFLIVLCMQTILLVSAKNHEALDARKGSMKIVHEVNQLDFGGVERVVRNLIKFDKTNEHTIISYRDGGYRKELEKVGAKIVLLADEKDTIDMDADVIHVHTGGGDSRLARQLGLDFPVIETIHSPVRSVIPSEFIRQRVGVSGAVAAMNHSCEVIHNGLDIDDLDGAIVIEKEHVRSALGIPQDAIVVGRLGRLGRDKGLEEWLLAVYKLQMAGHEVWPVIVGGASKEDARYFGSIKLMAASLPVKNIKFLGHQSDIMDYLQIMDIFLYPSPTEGFGLVFAEAMLAGCTVVAYKTDVTQELFAGYCILTERNVPALVQGLKKALIPELRNEYLGLSSDFIRSEYDARNMSAKYQELYERCNVNINVGR